MPCFLTPLQLSDSSHHPRQRTIKFIPHQQMGGPGWSCFYTSSRDESLWTSVFMRCVSVGCEAEMEYRTPQRSHTAPDALAACTPSGISFSSAKYKGHIQDGSVITYRKDITRRACNDLPKVSSQNRTKGLQGRKQRRETQKRPESVYTVMAANTPVLGQFLNYLNGFVAARNGDELGKYIQLEPPFGDLYQQMISELQRVYHKGQEAALDKRVTDALKSVEEASWTAFANFTVEYLAYLRDVSADQARYLETYGLLSELQK
nr:hypothetical protein CFP56_48802 [Quercus suber]